MPVQSSRALLIIFSIVPIVAIFICLKFTGNISISKPELISLLAFYVSCSLVYICLYSAIEQCSPTLSILTHIDSHGNEGCEDECILKHVKPDDEIVKRVAIMKQVKWIIDKDGNCVLTKQGRRIAHVFNFGAYVLGIKKGG